MVIVLEGANGNVYYQYSNPSTMYQGYNNSGTGPVAWQGNPLQIAPVTTIACGLQSCTSYFGGSITRISVRFTAYDGDTKAADFDVNKVTLGLNGTTIGNFSTTLTQTTNLAGTTIIGSSNGFGNNTYDTGWFQSTDATLAANILSTGLLKSTLTDATPNDNYWDFRQGSDIAGGVPPVVAPGVTLVKSTTATSFAAVGVSIPYTYVVKNIGTVWINPLNVLDDKIASVACGAASPAPTIAPVGAGQVDPGATVNCTGTYITTQADVDAGKVTNIATASGTPQFATLGAVKDTKTVPGPTRVPAIAVTKTAAAVIADTNGNGKIDAGDTINYTFNVTNTGNVTLTGVTVTDPSATVTGTLASLAPGITNSVAFTAKHILTQVDVDAGVVNNQATASGTPPSGVAGPVTDLSDPSSNAGNAVTATSIPRNASVALIKTAGAIADTNGNGIKDAGDTLSYAFTVTNTGTVTLTALSISSETNAIASGGPLASLAPGASNSVVFTAAHILTQAEFEAGAVSNSAVVTGSSTAGSATDTSDPSSIAGNAPTVTPLTRISGLFFDKSSATVNYNAVGNTITYKFLVKNTGNTKLTGINVTDILSGVIISGGPIAALAPGATDSTTLSATYNITQADIDAGNVINSAKAVASSVTGSVTSNTDSVTVPAAKSPAMTLVKSTSLPVTSIAPGQLVTYNYTIKNTGNTTLASPFTVTDNLIPSAGIICPAGNVAPTVSIVCSGTYTITQADYDFGSVTNTASAKSGTTTTPATSLTIPSGSLPSLSLVKSALPTTFTTVGQLITYKYDVTNSGAAIFINPVKITDDKIVGAFNCYVPPPNFAPTQTISCTKTYAVTQADLDAGFVTNHATASTIGPGAVNVTSAPAQATVTATQISQLTTTKSVLPTTVTTAGTVMNYTIVVKNTGNVTMSNVTVKDPLIASLTCTKPLPTTLAPVAGATPGQSFSCTGSYTATQADIDAGTMPNTATATGNNPQGTKIASADTVNPAVTRAASIGLVKLPGTLVDVNGNGRADANDKLSYIIKVTNTGNVTLTAISVSDVTATVSGGPLASLAPGATNSVTFTALHTLTQAEIDSGSNSNQATVTSTPPAGVAGPITDTSDESSTTAGQNDATLTPLTKVITLSNFKVLTGQSPAGPVALGTVLSFTVTSTNTGNVTQNNVVVLDGQLTPTTKNCLTLAPAGTCVLTGTHSVSQSEVDAGKFVNTGQARSDEVPTNQNSIVTTNIPQSTGITLVKTSTGITDGSVGYPANGKQDVGDVITYSLTVRNTGNISLTGVTVSDPNANVSGGSIGALAAGASTTISATHVITQADMDSAPAQVQNSAKVTGNPPTGPPVNDISGGTAGDDTPTTTSLAPVSSVQIVKSMVSNADNDGSGTVSLGDKLKYVITVTNTGTTTQLDVKISDAILGLAPSSPQCLNVAPAAACTVSLGYIVTQNDVDAGKIVNTASAVTKAITTPQTASVTTLIPQTDIVVLDKSVKEINGDPAGASFAVVGDLIVYTFTVSNKGNTRKPSVAITDPLDAAYTCAVPTLEPGASYTCPGVLKYVATQADLDAGKIKNTASATWPTGSVNSNTITVPAVQDPAVTIVKTPQITTTPFATGNTFFYDYVISNSGNTTLNGPFTLNDNLIPNANMTCGSPAGPVPATINLAPAQSLTCVGSYKITLNDVKIGSVTNTAFATIGGVASPKDAATIPTAANPGISLLKTAATNPPLAGNKITEVGQNITYTYQVTNTGSATLAEDIRIFDNKIASPILCWTSTAADPDFNPDPTAPIGKAGQVATCKADYTVTQADLDSGFVTNEATAKTLFKTTTLVESSPATATVDAGQSPALQISKTAAPLPPAIITLGNVITYTVHVKNAGNVTISGIVASDPLVPNLTCPSSSLRGTTDPAAAPLNEMDCTGTYIVTQADIDVGLISNTASVEGLTPQGVSVGPVSDTLKTDLAPAAPILKIVKTSSLDPARKFTDQNQDVIYFFAVTNTGNVTLDNVTVTDPLVAGYTCSIPRLIPGQTDSATCEMNYIVTQTDIDFGSVTNTAKVSATPKRGTLAAVSSNTVVITGPNREPAMTVVKQAVFTPTRLKPTKVGDTIDYKFTVANAGNVTVSAIVVVDAKCAAAPVLVNEDLVTNGLLDVRETQVYTCTSIAVTQAEIDAGVVNNTVTVTGTPAGGTFASPTTSTLATDVVQSPSLTLVKSAGSPTIDKGLDVAATDALDEIIYTFALHNTGNVTLSPISVTDAKITSVSCPVSTLAPNATTNCIATYVLKQLDLDAGSITNQATGSGTPPVTVASPTPTPVTDLSGTGETNDTKTVTPLTRTPKWSVLKKTASTPTKANDTLAYTFEVKNEGNVTITGVSVVDAKCAAAPSLTSGDNNSNSLLDVGETHVYSCTSIAVTQLEIDAGKVLNSVVVKGSSPAGPMTDATNSLTTTVVANAKLTLVKTAATPTINLGLNTTFTDKDDTIAYTFTVHNTGNVSLNSLAVTDPKIASVSCPQTTLNPDETVVCTASYTLLQLDIDSGGVTNQATAAAKDPSANSISDLSGTAEGNDTKTITPLNKTSAISLVKTAGTPTINLGFSSAVTDENDTILYTFTVANTGNVTLSALAVTDPKIGTVSCPTTVLLPSANMACTATYTLTQLDIDAGAVTNTAKVDGKDPQNIAVSDVSGTDATNDTKTVTSLIQQAVLTLVKVAGAPTTNLGMNTSATDVGDTIAYTFTVHNTGNVTLNAVAVTDPLIASISCSAPILAPNASTSCGATYTLKQLDVDAGKVTNQATASGTPPVTLANPAPTPVTDLSGTGEGNDTKTVSTFAPVSSLAVVKKITSTLSNPPVAGDVISYDITAHNTGTVTLTSIVLSDTLKDKATPTPNTLALTTGATLLATTDIGNDLKLSVGETWTYKATYKLMQADIDNGGVSNQATITAKNPGGTDVTDISGSTETDDLATDTSISPTSKLTVVKTANASLLNIPTKLNDKLTYSFVVTNTGNVTLTALSVTDVKISTINCPPTAPLAPIAFITCTADYFVTQLDLDAGTVSNQAIGSALDPKSGAVSAPSGNAPGNTSPTVTALTPIAHMVVKKSADITALSTPPKAGNVITYTMTILNDGNQTLHLVNLTDTTKNALNLGLALTTGPTLTSGDTVNPSFLDVDETWTYTATYKLTQADIDAGGVSNSLSVTAKDTKNVDVTQVSDDPDTMATPNDPTVTVFASVPSIALLKKIKRVNDDNFNGITDVGDSVSYEFDVSNTGNVTLSNVNLTDTLIASDLSVLKSLPVTGSPVSIAPTLSNNNAFTVKYPITQEDVERGYVKNTATVKGTSPTGVEVSDISDPDVTTGSAPTNLTIVPVRALGLTKAVTSNTDEDGNGYVTLGDTLNYTVTATNTGNLILTNIQVEDLKLSPKTSIACPSVAPAASCILTGSYKITAADVDAGKVLNSATAIADLIATALNRKVSTIVNPALKESQFTKIALRTDIHRGDHVPYSIVVTKVPLDPVRIIDLMPPGFAFANGSATVNGVAITPTLNGNNLTFDGLSPDANGIIKLDLSLIATAAAQTGPSVNNAQLVNPANGVVLAKAKAIVRIVPEHAFDCGEVIGKVFDDKNRNGYQDEGEFGLPGVRMATVKGLLITTDNFGRFHVACADIPDATIGSNFLMKLDTRTLPTGYRLTTENPRDVRLTRGKITKLNFGATISHVVKLDLNGKVFKPDSDELEDKWLSQLDTLISALETEPSTLRLNYYVQNDTDTLGLKRVAAVEKLISETWAEKRNRYKLFIETRVLRVEGAPSK